MNIENQIQEIELKKKEFIAKMDKKIKALENSIDEMMKGENKK